MTNITREVEKFLNSELAIQSCLVNRIINMTALAKYISEKLNLEVSIDSIITAIRRYDAECKFSKHNKTLKEVFKDTPIKTKTNLVTMDIRGRKNVHHCLKEINAIINLDKGDTLRLIKGSNYLRFITNAENIKDVEDKIQINKDMSQINDIVELSIMTNPNIDTNLTKGVMSKITNELAMNDINIFEIIFSNPYILIYVRKQDYMKAHQVLFNLSCNK
ncbi:MAG: hypothetical protein U9Q69_04610 [Nanoarchaeota archaeon]|nr:hypothetical protein [Nanoarchaeota archaeon]